MNRNPQGLELLVRDFRSLLEERFKGGKQSYFMKDVEEVWWNPGFSEERPNRDPNEYLQIVNNYEKLKTFITEMTEKGVVLAYVSPQEGYEGHDYHRYLRFLYENSQNQGFRENFGKSNT